MVPTPIPQGLFDVCVYGHTSYISGRRPSGPYLDPEKERLFANGTQTFTLLDYILKARVRHLRVPQLARDARLTSGQVCGALPACQGVRRSLGCSRRPHIERTEVHASLVPMTGLGADPDQVVT